MSRAWTLALIAVFLLTGADGPAIKRVRLPSREISKYFPVGTELRVMPAAEFDRLVAGAAQGAARRPATERPRLIRARHSARFQSGALSGRSEFVIEAASTGPADFVLEPWTPAVAARSGAHPVLRARDSGKPCLWIDQLPAQTEVLEWILEPRVDAGMRRFALELPGNETTRLTIEVPSTWLPWCRQGRRHGPFASAVAGQSVWEIEPESGRIDVRLDELSRGMSRVGFTKSVSGAIQIDLRRSLDRAASLFNWKADLRVEVDPRNLTPLELALDPGLELIDIKGPAVRGYRNERVEGVMHQVIDLDPGLASVTDLQITAHAQVPSEGEWKVPGFSLPSAVWTGGTVSLFLDEFHILTECRERTGRRVFAAATDSAIVDRLDFDAASPRSVADLLFRRPKPDTSCEVRGWLSITGAAARLECELKWSVQANSDSELEVDLGPGWIAQSVAIKGKTDPVLWHTSTLASRATRLHVALPSGTRFPEEVVLIVGAKSADSREIGPLPLPRVRPVSAAILDEAWIAWVDDSTMIQPTASRGLAWIDPGEVPGLLTARLPTGELHEALAWRWIADRAEASVDRVRVEQEPGASVEMRATVDSARQRLRLDGRMAIHAGAVGLDVIPIWISESSLGETWRFRDSSGALLVTRPLAEDRRTRLGFPREGRALEIVLKVSEQSQETIRFHAECAWSGHGLIPLVSLSREYLSRGSVIVDTPALVQARVKTLGLDRLAKTALNHAKALAGAGSSAPADDEDDDDRNNQEDSDLRAPRNSRVEVFGYTAPGGRLELFTDALAAPLASALVRDAHLTTIVDPGGTLLNRLRLVVNDRDDRAFDFTMPSGVALIRVRRDGADVRPIESSGRFSVSMASASQGSRSSTLVIDYVLKRRPLGDGEVIKPVIPAIELPCLCFEWSIITPPTWKAADCGQGLVAIDRQPALRWPYATLGLPSASWPFRQEGPQSPEQDVLRELDDRLSSGPAGELTFAEWFSRWDSGPWPVVIDRLGLGGAGVGPKSQCVAAGGTAQRRGTAVATLKRYGLALLPFDHVFVITSASVAAEAVSRETLAPRVFEALAWGSDRTDRLQTLARWRGELSPQNAAANGEEAVLRSDIPPGWSTWTFDRSSWPTDDTSASVHLIEVRPRIVLGWIIALACVLVWRLTRGAIGRWRLSFLSVLMVVSLVSEPLLPGRLAFAAAGLYLGTFGLLFLELGREAWRPIARVRSDRRSESSLLRRAAGAGIGMVAVCLSAGHGINAQPPSRDSTILALFPYDGPFDPARPPDHVILRLADFLKLKELAETPEPRIRSSVLATGALHRIIRKSDQTVVIESEMVLMATGHAPGSWSFPVSSAREIEVTLDGKRVPIAIEPGGARGTVAISPAGEHRLKIRRSVAAIDDDLTERIVLPINAAPFARAIVESSTDRAAGALLGSRGQIEAHADGSLIGLVGPVDRLEVAWNKTTRPTGERVSPTMEGLFLWDIAAAGDRVRARLSVHEAGKLETLRLAHSPGSVLRAIRVPGADEAFCEENADGNEWSLHVYPPLRAGSAIELEYWTPITTNERGGERQTPEPWGQATSPNREFPGIKPIGLAKYSGALGVRRPSDWTGRFLPPPGTVLISDESFVEAWGNLPEDALTFSGTTRFLNECRANLRTGPPPVRIQIKPSVEVKIESGRLAVTLDAELTELVGHLEQIEVRLPDGFRIAEVSAEGLSDWSVAAGQRLRMTFVSVFNRPTRRLRVFGWIAVNEDPLRTSTRQHQVKTPWFWWDGLEASAGFLTVSSISKPEMRGSLGLTLVSSESLRAGITTPPRHRATYRIDVEGKLGEIVWTAMPPRVNVAIESQLTIHPNSAEWVAVLRYDVVGGALDAIHLRMPAPWAADAVLRFSGSDYQLTKETSGLATNWSITPERPIWGSQRFVLHATRRLDGAREIDFPEVSPLGQGAVDAYLNVVDATDGLAKVENTLGLQSKTFPSRFRAGEFGAGIGAVMGTFRVIQKTWALRIKVPSEMSAGASMESGSARVVLGDITMVATSDRAILGRAAYETLAGSGDRLSFVLPPASTLLWAAVDGMAVSPLRSSAGTWFVNLDRRRSSRVSVIWNTSPPDVDHRIETKFSINLPRAGTGPTSSVVSIYAPDPLILSDIDHGGLEPAGMARVEIARADWISRSIGELVSRFDRSSGRDHEKLVAMLISHEMALRSAQRSIQWADTGINPGETNRPAREKELIPMARATRDEIIRRAMLEDDLTAARVYWGENLASVARPLGGVFETTAPERTRTSGRPSTLIGAIPGVDGSASNASLVFQSGASHELDSGVSQKSGDTLILLIALVIVIVAPLRGNGRRILAAAVALGLAGYTGGPLIFAGSLGLLGFGWRSVRA